MTAKPIVTVMIATKDRHTDLDVTLRDLRRQDFQNVEIIVIDDGSSRPVESIVEGCWPGAHVVRHEVCGGQSTRRNEGFRLAQGNYILQLDDDCSLMQANGISLSVAFMEANPGCPGIVYQQFHGFEMPAALPTFAPVPGYCMSFSGAAVFLRKAAVEKTAGYREFFVSYAEEGELALQLLKRGSTLSYRPEIVALHRWSPRNRDGGGAWKRSLRNNLWTILIHCPLSRIPLEVGWKVMVGAWDAFRLRRGKLFLHTLLETAQGARKVWKLRDPLDRLSLRRYDALRAFGVLPYELFEDPPPQNWSSARRWATMWRTRLSEASFFGKKDKPSLYNL